MASQETSEPRSDTTEPSSPNKEEAPGSSKADGVLHGTKIAEKDVFLTKDGQCITVTPLLLDFRRLLQADPDVNVVPGISNRDLLHAVVGLYDVSLSEMTPDTIYSAVTDRRGRTLVLIREVNETLKEIEDRKKMRDYKKKKQEGEEKKDQSEEEDKPVTEIKPEDDVYEAEEESPPTFAPAYSDTETEEEEEESEEDEEDEEEDYSVGIKSFLQGATVRRKNRLISDAPVDEKFLGAENRLVGCATYDKTYCKGGERVVHLTFIAVRKRFRKCNIGKYLLAKIKDNDVVGEYDAVVVHADNSAVDFFTRYGFTDDLVLNSKWSELAEQYTNCTLMSYLPPFTGQTLLKHSMAELDLIAMEREIKKWKEKSLDAYRAEASMVNRMRHEIIHLRALVSSQQDLIASLMAENEHIRQDKYWLEEPTEMNCATSEDHITLMDNLYRRTYASIEEKKKMLEYRLLMASTIRNGPLDSDCDIDDEETAELAVLSKQLQDQLTQKIADIDNDSSPAKDMSKYLKPRLSTGSTHEHGEDLMEFYGVSKRCEEAARLDPLCPPGFGIRKVHRISLSEDATAEYNKGVSDLLDKNSVTEMFFCGTKDKPESITRIISEGFTQEDMIAGDYGKGLYFSRYPTKAAQFSVSGKLLMVEVCLGTSQTIVTKDPTRTNTEEIFGSILTPGRLTDSEKGDNDIMLCQEYVIFSLTQAKPVYLVEYQTEPK